MLNVTFWGVRGSTPCSCEENRRYGGNTACVVLESPGSDPLILDLGTGLRRYGQTLVADGSFRGNALVTHLHWDHVQGLPFFAPVLAPGARLDIYGPICDGLSLRKAFEDFMRPPYFPVRPDELHGELAFHDLVDTAVHLGDFRVVAGPVPHVGPTNAYRVEHEGLVVTYVSDHQQPLDGSDHVAESVLHLAAGADVLIHDAQFTPEDLAVKQDWGHCTVEYAVHVALTAGVRRLVLFHHDPARDDEGVERLLAVARGLAAGHDLEVVAASEGLTLSLTSPVDEGTAKAGQNGSAAGAPVPVEAHTHH